jgi:nucleoside-diphosphate-sugar epimerase
MNNCIITGGSGFIGTHLIQSLLNDGLFDKITVIDIQEPRISDARVEYIHGDIRQPISIELSGDYSTCYHLAAVCKEPGFPWNEYFLTNYIGTVNVCDWMNRIGVKNLIFTSTMMVFRAGETRNHEESLTAPDTGYGMSKLLAEWVVKEWQSNVPDRRLRIVRLGVVFGQWENGNYTRLYYALKKRRFAYIGKKTTVKGSIYVKDTIRFLRFMTDDNHSRCIYHLVYPQPTTIKEICDTMSEVFGFSRRIPMVPYRLALSAAYGFEFLSALGLKNPIHHRRIQKLYYSTDISADQAYDTGFQLSYSLRDALEDWRKDCLPKDIY